MVDIKKLKKLRKQTGAGIVDCRKALEESKENLEKAKKWLEKKGMKRAEKKRGRETGAGRVEAYIHSNGLIGALISLGCETDFVAKTKEFKKLAHELAMQVAAMNPKTVEQLLEEDYIRNPKIKISGLIKKAIAKLGENIKIKAIKRLEI